MPKTIPPCPADAPTGGPTGGRKEYRIELITPLFGGGVRAGENDQTMPIRGTSIRGQLQFWWRATCGRLLPTAEMWRRQEEIFGSSELPSPLEVIVSAVEGLREVDPGREFDRFGPGSYALFPAVENGNRLLAEGLSFQLEVRWPGEERLRVLRKVQNKRRQQAQQPLLPPDVRDIATDIEAAVWAWLTFGGLGARSRRGAGAVHCQGLAVPAMGKPTLAARLFVGPSVERDGLAAWLRAVEAYRDFRQTPRGRRHEKTIQTRQGPKTIKVPGRSHWPEADSIRAITGCSLKPAGGASSRPVPADEDPHDHSKPVVPESILPAFPKAVLGLPINFHFADAPGKTQPGQATRDPQDVQLVPLLPKAGGGQEPGDRMASPVLTRPLHINGQWHPAMILFDAPWLGALEARLVGGQSMAGGKLVARNIPHSQIIDPALGSLRPMRAEASALEALITYLVREAAFTEITR